MNVEIGSEAAQFPEKENIKGIFVAVCSQSLHVRVSKAINQTVSGSQQVSHRDYCIA
jgi:hypothetical protein